MTDLVAIRVTIGLRPNGHADHPDWFSLPMITSEEDVNRELGIGWLYDKQSGHKEGSVDSPRGQQHGLLFVSKVFAQEAMDNLPKKYQVTVLNEEKTKTFWENKVTRHIPENRVDSRILSDLNLELQLRESLGQDVEAFKIRINNALDSTNDEPGIKKNSIKQWNDAKITHGITVVPIGRKKIG